MEKRKLLKRVCLDYETAERDIKKEISLEYYLLESDYYHKNENTYTYGFEIRKISKGHLEEVITEYGVGISEERATRFIEMLASNAVTPMTVSYVLEDMDGPGKIE